MTLIAVAHTAYSAVTMALRAVCETSFTWWTKRKGRENAFRLPMATFRQPMI